MSPVASQSGSGLEVIAPELFLPRNQSYQQGCGLLNGGDAYEAVFFQFVSCALQFHPSIGRVFPANQIIRRSKSLDVLALPVLKRSFQILAAWATHFYPRFSVRSALNLT